MGIKSPMESSVPKYRSLTKKLHIFSISSREINYETYSKLYLASKDSHAITANYA